MQRGVELDTMLDTHLSKIEVVSRALERARCQRIALQIRDYAASNQALDPQTRQHCAATADQIAALIEAMPGALELRERR